MGAPMSDNGVTFEDIIDEYVNPKLVDNRIIITNDNNLDIFEDSIIGYLENRGFFKSNPTDLIDSIKVRFGYLKRENISDENMMDKISVAERNVYDLIWDKIISYYDIHVELDTSDNIDSNFFTIVEDFYYFFVHEYGDNVKVLFHSYMIKHEDELYDKFKINMKKKDIGINSLKNKFDKKTEPISTIYHVDDIIDVALSSMKDDHNTIMELLVSYDEDEITFNRMKELFITDKENPLIIPKGVLGDDFGAIYLRPLEDVNTKAQLISSMTSTLIDEYKVLIAESPESYD